MPTSMPDRPPSAAAMPNTAWFTRLTSTPICIAASRSWAVARTAQPSFVQRRKTNSSSALEMPTPAISRSSGPMVPVPTWKRMSGNWLGSARGFGEKISITIWSSTKLMPMVASNGAMRTEFCSGRRPKRSMIKPTAAATAATITTVRMSGVRNCTTATQPT
jgi:hypothetical protein